MRKVDTPVSGLSLYENVIPHHIHKRLLQEFKAGIPEKNTGHYDGFLFPNPMAFDQAFFPFIAAAFKTMQACSLFRAAHEPPIQLGCTIVGYEVDSYIPRHMDSQFLSGDTVVVFSFGSPRIIHFYAEEGQKSANGKTHETILLPPRSMYVMAHDARYKWTHEIIANENQYKGKKLSLSQRYSLLFFEPKKLYQGELMQY